MDIGSIFLLLALLVLISLFIARPLFDRKTVAVTPEEDLKEHELSTLMAERDRVLTALEELDFDNTLGKIPQKDYPGQRERLLRQGAETLADLRPQVRAIRIGHVEFFQVGHGLGFGINIIDTKKYNITARLVNPPGSF